MESSNERVSPWRLPTSLAEFLELQRRRGADMPSPSRAAVRLATALAERLDAVVPSPFSVRAESGWVSRFEGAKWDGSSEVAGILDWDPSAAREAGWETEDWPFVDRVVTVCDNVLNAVQDMIAEVTAEPWPRLPRGEMAAPGSRADAELIYLWYGPDSAREEGAVVALPPISIASLEYD